MPPLSPEEQRRILNLIYNREQSEARTWANSGFVTYTNVEPVIRPHPWVLSDGDKRFLSACGIKPE